MVDGYSAKLSDGAFECTAKFEVRNAEGETETLPYYSRSFVLDK